MEENNNNQPYQSPQDSDDVLFCCKKFEFYPQIKAIILNKNIFG